MYKLLLFLSVILWVNLTFAQDKTLKFGETVSLADFSKTSTDTTAEAIVLYDFGESTFEIRGDDIFIVFKYHGIVKILKKAGFDRAALGITYYMGSGAKESVGDIKGFTYNVENGQLMKEKLAKDMIFHERVSDNISKYKFTLPKVKEGSIIEYTYTISTPINLDHNPRTWSFQGSVPVQWSEYRITIPTAFYYKIIMGGYLPLTINESKEINYNLGNTQMNAMYYRFAIKDAPAFRNESFITTSSDYVSKIELELAQIDWPGVYTKNYSLSWKDLNQTLLDDEQFGGVMKRTNFLKETATKIKAKFPTDTLAQIDEAVSEIQKSIKWNERTSIYCRNFKQVLEKKEGDSGDINLLLTSLLRHLGLDANPLIISTRGNGKINQSYALLKKFNGVLAHVNMNGKDLLFDATDKQLRTGVIPMYCLSEVGWLASATNARLVQIKPIENDRLFAQANLKITDDGELEGSFSKSYGGYRGWQGRTTFEKEGKDKFLENAKKARPNWDITKAEFLNTDDRNKTMEAKYDVRISEAVSQGGNLLFLKPIIAEGYIDNPFKQEKREYPVDFGYTSDENLMFTFELPKGYVVSEVPKNMSLALPENGGKFVYIVQQQEGKIVISSRISMRKTIYYATEYLTLKEFYNAIVAKHAEQIVLKKQ